MTGLIMLVFFLGTGVYAQESVNDRMRTAETAESPYTVRSEQDFIEQYNWLVATPIHEDEERRKEVTAALSTWIENNPRLEIDVDHNLLKFSETTPELLTIFMGGWAKYAIENNDYDDKLEGNMAGLESVIEFYEKNGEFMDKDKNVEKLMKLQDKGKLKRKVEKKM